MQLKMHMVTIEDLVPKGHFLRKLESALDLSFVYEETAKLYSHRYGRPPYDPVVMVKYLLVGYLYGIPSERQIEQRIQTDMALRWVYYSKKTDCDICPVRTECIGKCHTKAHRAQLFLERDPGGY